MTIFVSLTAAPESEQTEDFCNWEGHSHCVWSYRLLLVRGAFSTPSPALDFGWNHTCYPGRVSAATMEKHHLRCFPRRGGGEKVVLSQLSSLLCCLSLCIPKVKPR